jgi:hypothetical protein
MYQAKHHLAGLREAERIKNRHAAARMIQSLVRSMVAKHVKLVLREEKATELLQWLPMPGTLFGCSGWYQSPYYKPVEKEVDGFRDDMIVYFERVSDEGGWMLFL